MANAMVHPFIPRAEREPDMPRFGDMTVDLSAPPVNADGALLTTLSNGDIEVDFEPGVDEQPIVAQDAQDHYANLAESQSESYLSQLAQDVCEMVDIDIQSRANWYSRMARGMKMLGLVGNDKEPTKGDSKVVHPLLIEAIVQFQSRALRELFPATGPAKTQIVGEKTRERMEQADRVRDYLNYQSTIEDEDYQPESDKLLFLVAYEGSVFRKTYPDPITGKNVRRLVRAEDFIVPYSATSLKKSPRYAHRIRYTQDEMAQLIAIKFFRKVDLATPSNHTATATEYDVAKDLAEGKQNPGVRDDDNEHTVYEMNMNLSLPGFEREDGLRQPYVVTVERDSMKVLSIRRGWVEGESDLVRDTNVVDYVFVRGDGFYGYGLIHLAGGLGDAATDLLQSILDSAAFAGYQGGFKSKDAKIKGDVQLKPGLFLDTELSAEELSRAFHNPPFRDVPMSLVSILGALTEAGQRLVSTTEATIGDANNTGPVGTTVALIEQGSKVHTAIHSRLHVSLGHELRYLAKLNGRNLPPEGYPYDVSGESRTISSLDFDGRVDVIPVSDPNIFSQTQRIAIAQTTVQLADSAPELIDRRVAYKRMFEAIGTHDIDELMPEKGDIQRCDPVTENALVMVGKPIKAYLDQAHDAHIAVHLGEAQLMAAQGMPGVENFQRLIVAHIQEHMAMNHRLKFQQMIGMPLPPVNFDADPGEPYAQELPPQIENQIAVKAAEATQQLLAQMQAQQAQQEQAAQPEQPDPVAEQQRKAQADEMALAEELKRKDAQAQAEERRKDLKAAAEVERKDAVSGIDPALVKAATEFLQQQQIPADVLTPRRLAVVSRELDKSFAETLALLGQMQGGGQGVGPSPVAQTMGAQ